MAKYAILDVETTGGSPQRDKITDIAIFVYDGEKIIHEFESLVNPERLIPAYITALTGISNEMVEDAPYFYEIARDIISLTEDCIVVGHNVTFDYNFIKHEFRQLGYEYKRDTICTVKLARKLMPGQSAYKLDVLANALNIRIKNRHRASGDARATVDLFVYLRKIDRIDYAGKLTAENHFYGLHEKLSEEIIKSLPDSVGVYYFYDENQQLLYVGKSKNIYQRVHTHLTNEKSSRALEMKARIAEIDYVLTGSELVALLKESIDIKTLNPVFNRAQRRSISRYGLYSFTDDNGYLQLSIKRNSDSSEAPFLCFNSAKSARAILFKWVEEYQLCQKLCGLYESAGACFSYSLGECNGACIGEEAASVYNQRVKNLLKKYSLIDNSMFLMEQGRDTLEMAVIKIEHGKYMGYGYINTAFANSMDDLNDCINPYEDNRETRMIIRQYLEKNQHKMRIVYV